MQLPTEMIEAFCQFVNGFYGVSPTAHSEPKRGEYARFRLGSAFVFIRDHDDRSKDAATVEVFSSDTKRIEEIEKAWIPCLRSMLSEEPKDGNENDGSSGNGTSTDTLSQSGDG